MRHLKHIVSNNKSVKVVVVIVVLILARVAVNSGFSLDERVAVRAALSCGWSTRWLRIIGVAVLIMGSTVAERRQTRRGIIFLVGGVDDTARPGATPREISSARSCG